MLEINSVVKGFDDKIVLDGVKLTINGGSIFGLVGVNGAGKSTLLRCISGIYKTDEGNVLFDARDTFREEEIRRDIFFANDDPYYPLASNIKSLKEFYASFYPLDEQMYQKTLKLFGLDENRQINTFSKGMKRQTLLLFALSVKPKLLLLDEAFDGLDPLVRYNLKKALYDFIEENHATIIISSHNLKELEDICDSYGILENGKISTYGDLLESNRISTSISWLSTGRLKMMFLHSLMSCKCTRKVPSIRWSSKVTGKRLLKSCRNLIRLFWIHFPSTLKNCSSMNMREEKDNVFKRILYLSA